MSGKINRKNSGIFSIFISVLVVILMLAAMELGLGLIAENSQLADPSDGSVKRHIRLREHLPLTNVTFERGVPTDDGAKDSANGSYRLRVDRNGFIYPSEIHEEPDLKIVFLGGSTTECLYMEEEERFPYLAGRYIESDGLKVNSYNGGVSGNNSMHSVNILLNKVLPLEPDFVVFMHNINDLAPLMYYGTYWHDTQTRSLVVARGEPGPLEHLYKASKKAVRSVLPNTYHAIKRAQDRFGDHRTADEWQGVRETELEVDEHAIKESFRRSLLTFIHIAKVHSIVPVLMTQARRASLSGAAETDRSRWHLRTKLFDEFNEIVREVSREQDVHLIDLNQIVPKDEDHMYDSLHFSSTGSNLVAEVIAGYFQENLLSP